jgi:hypothetical protein
MGFEHIVCGLLELMPRDGHAGHLPSRLLYGGSFVIATMSDHFTCLPSDCGLPWCSGGRYFVPTMSTHAGFSPQSPFPPMQFFSYAITYPPVAFLVKEFFLVGDNRV